MSRRSKNNFAGYEKIRSLCLAAPKMGNNDDYVDDIAVELTDCFADSVSGLKNDRGGIFRAGTGSAMYYIWFSENLGATPTGGRRGSLSAPIILPPSTSNSTACSP